jgi:hypothetical protein
LVYDQTHNIAYIAQADCVCQCLVSFHHRVEPVMSRSYQPVLRVGISVPPLLVDLTTVTHNQSRARAKTLRRSIRLAGGGRTAAADGGAGPNYPSCSRSLCSGLDTDNDSWLIAVAVILGVSCLWQFWGCGNSGVETSSRRQVREESACERQAD